MNYLLNIIYVIRNSESGQMTVEYAVMFAVIAVAIIVGATAFIAPSINMLLIETGGVINRIAEDFAQNAYP